MFTGMLIEDLIRAVERAEQHTHVSLGQRWPEPENSAGTYPLFSAFAYLSRGMELASGAA
jgi:hypothetical protein